MDYILSKLFMEKLLHMMESTDILFHRKNKTVTNKLGDIWNGDINNTHFETRLIPLNKVHPDTPSPKTVDLGAVCSFVDTRKQIKKIIETYDKRDYIAGKQSSFLG